MAERVDVGLVDAIAHLPRDRPCLLHPAKGEVRREVAVFRGDSISVGVLLDPLLQDAQWFHVTPNAYPNHPWVSGVRETSNTAKAEPESGRGFASDPECSLELTDLFDGNVSKESEGQMQLLRLAPTDQRARKVCLQLLLHSLERLDHWRWQRDGDERSNGAGLNHGLRGAGVIMPAPVDRCSGTNRGPRSGQSSRCQ